MNHTLLAKVPLNADAALPWYALAGAAAVLLTLLSVAERLKPGWFR